MSFLPAVVVKNYEYSNPSELLYYCDKLYNIIDCNYRAKDIYIFNIIY